MRRGWVFFLGGTQIPMVPWWFFHHDIENRMLEESWSAGLSYVHFVLCRWLLVRRQLPWRDPLANTLTVWLAAITRVGTRTCCKQEDDNSNAFKNPSST